MKHILGLDLGTNSIGWAVINAIKEENTQKEQLIGINTAGSRIIPMDAAQLGDFNKGNTVSQTANRTQFRGVRRLYERKKLRRERLHRILQLLGFLPKHYASQLGEDIAETARQLGMSEDDVKTSLNMVRINTGLDVNDTEDNFKLHFIMIAKKVLENDERIKKNR